MNLINVKEGQFFIEKNPDCRIPPGFDFTEMSYDKGGLSPITERLDVLFREKERIDLALFVKEEKKLLSDNDICTVEELGQNITEHYIIV